MKRVYICSPFSGDVNQNVLYARAAMRHSLLKGEAPFAPHLLYTQPQVLNDSDPDERKIGSKAALAYLQREQMTNKMLGTEVFGCSLLAVYYDRGISKGMREEIEEASKEGVPLEFRSLKQTDDQLWKPVGFHEGQDRNLTGMWLDEQDRVETE